MKRRIKSLLADRTCNFWTFLFPVILILCFSLTIPKSKNQSFYPVRVALAKEQAGCKELYRAMKKAKTCSKKPFFQVNMCSEVMCKEKLKNQEIDVYVVYEKKYQVVCNQADVNSMLVKEYIEWYQREGSKEKMVLAIQDVVQKGGKHVPDCNEIYLLTLLSLAAFLSFHWGIRIAYDLQGNQSMLGKHLAITPLNKRILWMQSIGAVIFVELFFSLILDCTVMMFRKMNLLPVLPEVLGIQMLTCIMGGLAGVIWCNILKGSVKSKHKRGELVVFLVGFLSGIMISRVRYFLEIKMPIISRLNPVSVATDALFHVYYRKDFKMLFKDINNLLAMEVILILIVIRIFRRKTYECL